MGYPGKSRKMYERPRTPWQAERIAGEVEVVKAFGLRNKRELWKAQAVLRKYRQISRKMLAAVSIGQAPQEAEAILARLKRLGMLKEEGDLDAVLSMKVSRRSGEETADAGLPPGARQFLEAVPAVHRPRPYPGLRAQSRRSGLSGKAGRGNEH